MDKNFHTLITQPNKLSESASQNVIFVLWKWKFNLKYVHERSQWGKFFIFSQLEIRRHGIQNGAEVLQLRFLKYHLYLSFSFLYLQRQGLFMVNDVSTYTNRKWYFVLFLLCILFCLVWGIKCVASLRYRCYNRGLCHIWGLNLIIFTLFDVWNIVVFH